MLEIFRKPTIKLQSSNYSNIYFTISYITKLLIELDNLTLDNNENLNPYISTTIIEAYNKLEEYFPIKNSINIDKLRDLYLSTLLNPKFKLEYFRENEYSDFIINLIKDYFIEVYNKYKEEYNNNNLDINSQVTTSSTNIYNNLEIEDISDEEFYIDNRNINTNTKEKYEIYLEEIRISKKINIIDYYKANKKKFPIIYNIVLDYLAIMTTSASNESIFSKTNNIITKKRNRLLASNIKQIILLKN